MQDITLVIMAAGIGSRFEGGIKQLEPVSSNGEIIVDFSIYDAIEAGFNKVVFVIRKDLYEYFEETIGKRIKDKIKVEYVFQEVADIPAKYKNKFKSRTKPWGTGQAILACKDVVKEPFLVINADDYYGKVAYIKAYQYLTDESNLSKKNNLCLVGFILKNTLSDNGTVTRGICEEHNHRLIKIQETPNIERKENLVIAGDKKLNEDSLVSMNMWGFYPEFIDLLLIGFLDFLEDINKDDLKSEFLLPVYINELLNENKIEVDVLKSTDKWFGVTYKEDKDNVVENIKTLIEMGQYQKLKC
ncbi:MAG: sugar phosphate nucleotidyltransferase [Thomasclavelia sp.]